MRRFAVVHVDLPQDLATAALNWQGMQVQPHAGPLAPPLQFLHVAVPQHLVGRRFMDVALWLFVSAGKVLIGDFIPSAHRSFGLWLPWAWRSVGEQRGAAGCLGVQCCASGCPAHLSHPRTTPPPPTHPPPPHPVLPCPAPPGLIDEREQLLVNPADMGLPAGATLIVVATSKKLLGRALKKPYSRLPAAEIERLTYLPQVCMCLPLRGEQLGGCADGRVPAGDGLASVT